MDLSDIPKPGPTLAAVSRLVAVEKPRAQSESRLFHMDVDFEREDFYTETRFVGDGPFTPRFDFVAAVRRFIL